MKKSFYLAGCLLLAGVMCWSCSDDDGSGNGNGNGDAVFDKGTQTEQVVYADEEGIKSEGIKFTTKGPWKAEVEEVTARAGEAEGKTVDWLTLSQYSGDKAGAYTLTLTLKQNYTGKSRKAVIRIICGKTVITITVEQKAENNDGVKLKRVKSVNYVVEYGPGCTELGHSYDDDVNYTYSYDEQGRVAKVVQSYKDEASTYLFDYHIVDEITVIEKNDNFDPDISDDYRYEHLLTLNKEGNVENVKSTGGSGYVETFKAAYTEDGRLAKIDEESWYGKYSYANGLLTKIKQGYAMYPDSCEFDVVKTYPNRYPATRANINFNAFILKPGNEDMASILFQIGLLGKGSDCLMEYLPEEKHEEGVVTDKVFNEPGKVYKYEEKEIKYPETKNGYTVKYELDGDKYVTKFLYTEPYEVYNNSYEIHVGHELIEPNNPKWGYKYEIKNEKWTKLGDEKNTFTYTVTYE